MEAMEVNRDLNLFDQVWTGHRLLLDRKQAEGRRLQVLVEDYARKPAMVLLVELAIELDSSANETMSSEAIVSL